MLNTATRHQPLPPSPTGIHGLEDPLRDPLLSTAMSPAFRGEDTRSDIRDLPTERKVNGQTHRFLRTHYDRDDRHAASTAGGVLTQRGAPVHSADRVVDGEVIPGARRLWSKDKDERLNYAMRPQGDLRVADPRAEVEAMTDPVAGTTERSNHSSLVAGGDVAAAGTMKVRDGKVEAIDNHSGHYKPSFVHAWQAVRSLVDDAVMDPARSTVELFDPMDNHIQMTPEQLFAWEPELRNDRANARAGTPTKTAEDGIRAIASKKRSVHHTIRALKGAPPSAVPPDQRRVAPTAGPINRYTEGPPEEAEEGAPTNTATTAPGKYAAGPPEVSEDGAPTNATTAAPGQYAEGPAEVSDEVESHGERPETYAEGPEEEEPTTELRARYGVERPVHPGE